MDNNLKAYENAYPISEVRLFKTMRELYQNYQLLDPCFYKTPKKWKRTNYRRPELSKMPMSVFIFPGSRNIYLWTLLYSAYRINVFSKFDNVLGNRPSARAKDFFWVCPTPAMRSNVFKLHLNCRPLAGARDFLL